MVCVFVCVRERESETDRQRERETSGGRGAEALTEDASGVRQGPVLERVARVAALP